MKAGCRISFLLASLVCLAPAGCRHNTNQELLENELRARDLQYREALDELKKYEFQKDVLHREVESLRGGALVSPELAAHTFGIRRISLGRGTSAIDTDHLPGDDALQIVLEPRDGDDHIIKAPGHLEIIALEINAQGGKAVLCTWDAAPEDMRQNWKSGLFSTGYILVLPWKSWPQSENLRIIAKLTLTDGRVFEADKDIRVRLASGVMPHPGPDPLPAPREGPQLRAEPKRVQQATWQPAPLGKIVGLGRPEPIDPRPPVPLIGLTNEAADPFEIWAPRD